MSVLYSFSFSSWFIMMRCFNDFSVLSWNVRRAGSKVGRRHVKNLVQKFRPSIFIVLETQIPFRKALNF